MNNESNEELIKKIQTSLTDASRKCQSEYILLSGGLDSSILAYILKDRIKGIFIISEDFIGTDRTYNQIIKNELKIPVYTKEISIKDIIDASEETIKILKNFNDIEIRNSVVMYLALEKASKMGITKIMTGDGADELFAGYSFLVKKNNKQIQNELERVWDIMHFTSQPIAKHFGIVIESPFLDETFQKIAKQIPAKLKVSTHNEKKIGKWILRKAFETKIPKSIIWREKSAMQDGAGIAGITSMFDNIIPDDKFQEDVKDILEKDGIRIRTKESLTYYKMYRKYFDAPKKQFVSSRGCPDCNYSILQNAKFCKMCGRFPI